MLVIVLKLVISVMGCCSTAEPTAQLQFHDIDLYDSSSSNKNARNKATKSTDPSEHTITQKMISQISSDRSMKCTDHSQSYSTHANSFESEDLTLVLAQTWPTLQPHLISNQNYNQAELQNRGNYKKVTFSEPSLPQKPLRVFNFTQNMHPRIRFGPLTTINQQQSQMAQTVKLSELGSKAELNVAGQNYFQD